MSEIRHSGGSWLRSERVMLAALLAFTLVVRATLMFAMRHQLTQDPDAYRQIAENVLRHGVYAMDPPQPTAFRPPLYPLVLSNLSSPGRPAVSLSKVAAMHVALGLGTVFLTWLVACRFVPRDVPGNLQSSGGDGPRSRPTMFVPIVAGILVACDPILLNQQTLIMTETLAAFLAAVALWRLSQLDERQEWFHAALAGGAIGLAALCRPTFLPWLALVLGAVLVARRNRSLAAAGSQAAPGIGRRVANCAALAVGAAIVLAPWAIRNQQVFGQPIVTTTHGGYTLWLGNNRDFYKWLQSDDTGLPWDVAGSEQPPSVEELGFQFLLVEATEPERDRLWKRRAYAEIRAAPGAFLRACLYRVGQLWSPLPNKLRSDESPARTALRYATAGWYCAVFFLVFVAAWRLRQRLLTPPWIWGVLLCLAFTAVHTVYWSNLRMRAPLMPWVAILAAYGAGELWQLARRRSQAAGGPSTPSEAAGTGSPGLVR